MKLEGSLPFSQNPDIDRYLTQIHTIHNFPPYFLIIHSNIILPYTPRSSEWSLPYRFSDQNFVFISNFYTACYKPSNLIPLGLVTLIILGEACKLRSSSSCSLVQRKLCFCPAVWWRDLTVNLAVFSVIYLEPNLLASL